MIYTKDLRELNLKTIEQYFLFVVESYLNNPIKIALVVYKSLSEKQRLDFFDWAEINYPNEAPQMQQEFENILENEDDFNSLNEN